MSLALTKEQEKKIVHRMINRVAERMINKDQNFFCVFIGEPGTGKSEGAEQFGYLVEKAVVKLLKKKGITSSIDPDTIYDRTVFSAKQFMDITETVEVPSKKEHKEYKLKHLKKGNVVIWDEAGAGDLDNQKWQTSVSVAVNHVFQTTRSDNLCVIFTVPYRDWINKKIRALMHGTFETIHIMRKTNRCLMKFTQLRKNHKTGAVIDVYPRVIIEGRKIMIDRILMPKLKTKIRNRYKHKKEAFNFLTKQRARDKIDELSKVQEEEFPRIDDMRIEEIVQELTLNIRKIGRFTQGKWSIAKDVIIGLYKVHPKDATTIRALIELKANG